MNILLLGPQGSGKGTQAKRIAAEYAIPHIATGDMLRSEIAAGTPLGRQVDHVLKSGQLVSDELMIAMIRGRIEAPDTEPGFVLDGFPRTMVQAEALDAVLGEIDRALRIVFELQISDELCVERLLKRARQENRPDDTPEVIAERLAIYHEQTEPLVEHYRAQGIVVGIHADGTVNEVFAEIQQALEQTAVR